MASIVEWGETFLFHVVSREFQLEQPKPSVICQHGADRRNCDAKVQLQYSQMMRNVYPSQFLSAKPHSSYFSSKL